MKKTILKRSVASTLSFLMAFSTAVPNSVVYAEESGIESEIAQDYAATLSQTQNGTTSFVTDGNKTKGPTTHVQGDKVEVAVEPDEGFNTAKIEVKNTDGTVVASLEDGKVTANDKGNYTFEMPASDVTISVSFEAVKKETADAETKTTGSETKTEKREAEEEKEQAAEEAMENEDAEGDKLIGSPQEINDPAANFDAKIAEEGVSNGSGVTASQDMSERTDSLVGVSEEAWGLDEIIFSSNEADDFTS